MPSFFKIAAIQLFDSGTRKKLEIFFSTKAENGSLPTVCYKKLFCTVRPNLSRKIVPGKDAR